MELVVIVLYCILLFVETGRVFTFGANDWGQLGLDHTKPANKPTCVKSKF